MAGSVRVPYRRTLGPIQPRSYQRRALIVDDEKRFDSFNDEAFEEWLKTCPVKDAEFVLDTDNYGMRARVTFVIEEEECF
tara:strand:- start:10 stop:249 length:240 start_codon:yes stop_codon:yes gene_type:complete